MKFLHVADLHLDRTFEGLGQVPQTLLSFLSQQNKQLLTKMVDTALAEAVDFVLIVGDTFHQPVVALQTQSYFMTELARLEAAQIPVVLTFGNHDYFLPEKYWFEFPSNVHVIRSEVVQSIELQTKQHETVVLSGFSYNQRWLEASKVSEFPARDLAAAYHLGLYHGEQGQAHEQGYAPFSLSEMSQKNYDYWALGHIHQPRVLQEEPLIIYPGTPLGHSQKERVNPGFLLVEFNGQQGSYQWLPQELLTWGSLRYDCIGTANRNALLTEVERELFDLMETSSGLILCEIILEGSIEAMAQFSHAGDWEEELLHYFQESVYRETQGKIWPYRLRAEILPGTEKLPPGVSMPLLTQLSDAYQAEERFAAITEELYRQSEFQQLLPQDEESRASQLESVKRLVVQKLGFENEGRG